MAAQLGQVHPVATTGESGTRNAGPAGENEMSEAERREQQRLAEALATTTPADALTHTLTIPNGSYTLQSLEERIARELYRHTNFQGIESAPSELVTRVSGLYHDMNLLASAQRGRSGGLHFLA